MVTHAILAAGRGTRLFGEVGGNKAMVPLDRGHLIDYVVRETESLPLTATRVLVPYHDRSIAARVTSLTGSKVIPVPSPSDGTGPGIRRLLNGISSELIALTTCDLIAPRGALSKFMLAARELLGTEAPRCVVATSSIDELDPVPIYVHASNGMVTAYGKTAPRSERTFAGARLMNLAFVGLLLRSDEGLTTDTAMMAEIVKSYPDAVLHIDVDGLFDVDDGRALSEATKLTKEDRHD
ncbi:hypothetical protein ARZXY2_4904 (plasmid) [Arthrobacter sp. ZXY-2]|nr:hypothetical protein ARZXY2_4904 [Arthrobacter sp. ZXY-2]